MQMSQQSLDATPLDTLERPTVQRPPALTWLIYYGAFNLFIRFIYSIGMPLMTRFIANDLDKIKSAYFMFNVVTNGLGLAISIAIAIFVKDRLCQIIFGLLALANLSSLVVILLNPFQY